MKTFRVIGIALFAVLFCINFTSCSEDEPGGSGTTSAKKLVAATLYNGSLVIVYSYDKQGRLIKSESEERTFHYTWPDGAFTIERYGYGKRILPINNGLLERLYDDEMRYDLTYNASKKLSVVRDTYLNREMSCFWDGNKLKQIDINYMNHDYNDKSVEFTYSGKTCKGYSPMHVFVCEDYLFDFDFTMALPEMVGLKTNQLVSMIKDDYSTTEFSYTFTEDGYLESCTEHRTTPNGYRDWTRVYKFIWK